ncbi:MAG: Fe-S oxidoreductase, partial [Proteobacteria bacterium]|nr:Fe-S oxidoreductase [Pseudomonadota bacterium]
IEHLTGCAVHRIEGDLPQARSDVFGFDAKANQSASRKVIPIKVSNA